MTDAKIGWIIGIVLLIIYLTVIGVSLYCHRPVRSYLVILGLQLLFALVLYIVVKQPTNDPQAGMGLGVYLIGFGAVTGLLSLIVLVLFTIAMFRK